MSKEKQIAEDAHGKRMDKITIQGNPGSVIYPPPGHVFVPDREQNVIHIVPEKQN